MKQQIVFDKRVELLMKRSCCFLTNCVDTNHRVYFSDACISVLHTQITTLDDKCASHLVNLVKLCAWNTRGAWPQSQPTLCRSTHKDAFQRRSQIIIGWEHPYGIGM